MKKIIITLLMAASVAASAQAFPFDFESSTAGMVGYDGASFTIVSNPSSVGNSSSNVAKIVKVNAADLWAGGKITSVSSLNFTSASSSVLSMKVYTTQPVGTVIKIKLESPYTSEVDAVTTVSGAWETLTFDFGIPAPSGSVDLVIMPQPFTPGGGNTFYIDDIEQVAGVIATPRLGLPVTFESGTTARHFFDFESAIMTSLPNPDVDADNGSPNVGKIVRFLGAPYGGSKITFANNLDFVNHPVITMKVWTSAPIGTNVTLKAEKPFWGEERSVQTTKTEEWETLSFDFTNAPTDMPTLALLFDFIAGSTNIGDGSSTSTFYFDDIKYANVAIGIEDESKNGMSIYPNPTADQWVVSNLSVDSYTIQLYDLNGQQLYHAKSSGPTHTIDASHYAVGVYLAKIQSGSNEQTVRLIKY
jgi:hypothetical protein